MKCVNKDCRVNDYETQIGWCETKTLFFCPSCRHTLEAD